VRLLLIPGLHDSGPAHWQSWLQRQYRGAARVRQRHWHTPDLAAWSEQIERTVNQAPAGTRWVAVAHSFGSLALVDHLAQRSTSSPNTTHSATQRATQNAIHSALIVAPANPAKFGLDTRLHTGGLGIPALVMGSENDPWMPLEVGRQWAEGWGAHFLNLGPAGHVNVESGHGAWPWIRWKVDHLLRDQHRALRLQRAHPMELSYAV
jgi:predicted alpha/beta hydrolase family esterase